jgi:hypothetical protein
MHNTCKRPLCPAPRSGSRRKTRLGVEYRQSVLCHTKPTLHRSHPRMRICLCPMRIIAPSGQTRRWRIQGRMNWWGRSSEAQSWFRRGKPDGDPHTTHTMHHSGHAVSFPSPSSLSRWGDDYASDRSLTLKPLPIAATVKFISAGR